MKVKEIIWEKCHRAGCNNVFALTPNKKYCPECKIAIRKETKRRNGERQKSNRALLKQARAAIVKHKAAEKPVLCTDEEQKRADEEFNKRHSSPCFYKQYKKGTKEYKQIAQDIIDRRNGNGNLPAERNAERPRHGFLPSNIRQYVTA